MDNIIEKQFAGMVTDLFQGKIYNLDPKLLHAAMGIGTESGEIMDIVKKNMFYNTSFDLLTLKEECSDLLHYLQMILNHYGSSLEEIMVMNIAKLSIRYPEGYTQEKALSRDKKAEREAMERVEKVYHKEEQHG